VKVCKGCGVGLPIESFSNNKREKDGLQRICKSCTSEYKKAYYLRNSLKVKQAVKQYRLDNPEVVAERKKKYYEANTQAIVEKVSRWRKDNPDKESLLRKKWRENHPEQIANYAAARRAKMKSNGVFMISEREIKALYEQPCFYCGSKTQIQIDHVVPISRGGTHSLGNIVPACWKCNIAKSNKLLVEWKNERAKNGYTND
jgi:5-methylcytosine-specific restriction endonuclease McrA